MKKEEKYMKVVNKNNIYLITVVFVLTLGTIIYLLYGTFYNPMKAQISASREYASLQKCVSEAAAVVEVKMEGIDSTIETDNFPQTIHNATIIKIISGNLPDNIKILQDGTTAIPVSDEPIFKSGEHYIFTLKKATGNIPYDNVYWITKEFYVNGDAAVEMIPSADTCVRSGNTEIETLSIDECNSNIKQKVNQVQHEVDIIKKEDLLQEIEKE